MEHYKCMQASNSCHQHADSPAAGGNHAVAMPVMLAIYKCHANYVLQGLSGIVIPAAAQSEESERLGRGEQTRVYSRNMCTMWAPQTCTQVCTCNNL